MEDMVSMAINLHILFVAILSTMALWNMWSIKNSQEYSKISRRLELINPQYNINIAAVVFTGIIVWATVGFNFDIAVIFMSICSVVMIVTSAKKYKYFKKARDGEIDGKVYLDFANKKYFTDLILIFLMVLVTYGVPVL
jgi:membrane protein implicated in regulation of membrane protease activity